MRIVIIVQQTFDIEAATLLQAHCLLREGCFPSGELLLAVKDEIGHDITEEWRQWADKAQD